MNSTDFDDCADQYDSQLNRGLAISGESRDFFAKQRVVWLARCLRRLAFAPEAVLDYGCGTGTATPFLIELLRARSVVGVDLSPKSLDVARQAHCSLPVQYRSTQEHDPDGTVDLVFCNGVLHHVPPEEQPQVIDYIGNCLRPGGVLALWENNPFNPGTRYIMNRIPFDRDAIPLTATRARSLVTGAGLSTIRTDYCFIFPKILRVFRPMEPYLTRLPLGAQYQVLSRKRNC